MRVARLRPEFVEFMPQVLENGVLYVSMTYSTVIHLCCCGCGNRVVTPLAPDEWSLRYDGVAVWLDPSVGNWSFPCQSHYWIRSNRIEWARRWSPEEIEVGRRSDRALKRRAAETPPAELGRSSRSVLQWLKGLFTE